MLAAVHSTMNSIVILSPLHRVAARCSENEKILQIFKLKCDNSKNREMRMSRAQQMNHTAIQKSSVISCHSVQSQKRVSPTFAILIRFIEPARTWVQWHELHFQLWIISIQWGRERQVVLIQFQFHSVSFQQTVIKLENWWTLSSFFLQLFCYMCCGIKSDFSNQTFITRAERTQIMVRYKKRTTMSSSSFECVCKHNKQCSGKKYASE